MYAADSVDRSPAEVEERLSDLRRALQAATGSAAEGPAGDGSFLLDVPTRAMGRDVAKQVRVRTGVLSRSGRRVVLPLSWRAEPSGALFATFEGALELEELAQRCTGITVVGAATPPLGPLGALIDVTLLHTLGDQTARLLVASLCRYVTSDTRRPEEAPSPSDPLAVADLMTAAPLVVTEDTSLRRCAELLSDHDVSGLPVVDGNGALVGVLSETDLLPRLADERFGFGRRARSEVRRRAARTAGAACSRPARCTAPDASLAAAVREMLDGDVDRLVVVGGGEVVGILTRHDVIRALTRSDAAIQRAVEALLQERRLEGVEVDVLAGHVQLRGEVERSSTWEELVRLVGAAPGVDELDADGLAWRHDDLTPVVAPPLM